MFDTVPYSWVHRDHLAHYQPVEHPDASQVLLDGWRRKATLEALHVGSYVDGLHVAQMLDAGVLARRGEFPASFA